MKKYLTLKETQERLALTKTLTESQCRFIHNLEEARGHPMTAAEILAALKTDEK